MNTADALILKLTARDPIIVRDGRPFGETQRRMHPLEWPYPSVLAGSLRTLIAKSAGKSFSDEVVEELLRIAVAGPFPVCDGQLYFPAPADAWRLDAQPQVAALRPESPPAGAGTDLPPGLLPVVPPFQPEANKKPLPIPRFWAAKQLERWLADPCGLDFKTDWTDGFRQAPTVELRTHVSIQPSSGAAQEGMLFTTAGLALDSLPGTRRGPVKSAADDGLELRVQASGWALEELRRLDAFHPLGGERRLAYWKANKTEPWSCPPTLRTELAGAKRIRMVLATPALFAKGWRPGWLSDNDGAAEGDIPESEISVRLVGAALPKWLPISGWSLKPPRGPKAIRRLVPAGSVFFFERIDGNPGALAHRWLESVCDDPQDRRDGFGLALWGIWDHHQPNTR